MQDQKRWLRLRIAGSFKNAILKTCGLWINYSDLRKIAFHRFSSTLLLLQNTMSSLNLGTATTITGLDCTTLWIYQNKDKIQQSSGHLSTIKEKGYLFPEYQLSSLQVRTLK